MSVKFKVLMKVFALACVFGGLPAEDWFDKIKFNGDFRYRYEYIDDEPKNEEVHRNRIRARVGLKADIHEDLKFDFRISTGKDTTSRNQDLESTFDAKDIYIDKANVVWTPSYTEGLNVTLGKFGNPFWAAGKSDLLWDGDVTPEGGFVGYEKSWETFSLKTALAGLWFSESSSGVDSGLLVLDVVGTMKFLDEKLAASLGVSYYNLGNPESANNFAAAGDADQDYDLINAGLEVSYKFEFAKLSVFADFIVNTGDETEDDTGILVGFKLGEIKEAHDWQFTYDFRELEAQAAPSNLPDGDVSGGGTDVVGHRIGFKFAIYKPWTVGATIMVGEKGVDNGTDYTRIQIDTAYKF